MTESDVQRRSDARGHPGGWVAVTAALIAVVLIFAARRVAVDVPHLTSGTVPDDGIDREYALHPRLAATHIGLGVVYLLGASLQLWRPFRVRHYQAHRRIGRVLAPLAAVSGASGVIFGARYAFGGRAESAASVLFGSWFVLALVLAVVAIRRGTSWLTAAGWSGHSRSASPWGPCVSGSACSVLGKFLHSPTGSPSRSGSASARPGGGVVASDASAPARMTASAPAWADELRPGRASTARPRMGSWSGST